MHDVTNILRNGWAISRNGNAGTALKNLTKLIYAAGGKENQQKFFVLLKPRSCAKGAGQFLPHIFEK